MRPLTNELKALEKEIRDLEAELREREAALPAHSVQPQQLMKIEELEEAIAKKRKILDALKNRTL